MRVGNVSTSPCHALVACFREPPHLHPGKPPPPGNRQDVETLPARNDRSTQGHDRTAISPTSKGPHGRDVSSEGTAPEQRHPSESLAAGPSKRRPDDGGLRMFVRVSPFRAFERWRVAGWERLYVTMLPCLLQCCGRTSFVRPGVREESTLAGRFHLSRGSLSAQTLSDDFSHCLTPLNNGETRKHGGFALEHCSGALTNMLDPWNNV